MGIGLELKKSSKQGNSLKPMQERVLLPPANRAAKHRDKSTVKKNHFDPLHSGNLRSEFTKEAARSSVGHCRQSNKSNAVEDGELVKHMTNLPGYLKGVEKAENFQDKALNVGVLDWSRLEQWKHKQKNALEIGSSSASRSTGNSLPKRSSGSSRPSSSVQTSRLYEQHPSLPRNVERSVETAVRFQVHSTPSRGLNSYSRSHTGVTAEKEMTKGTDRKMIVETGRASAEFKSFGTFLHPKENSSSRHVITKKAVEVPREADTKRKNVDPKIFSGVEASSAKFEGCDAPLHPMEKKSARRIRTHSRVQDLKQSNFDLANQSYPEQGNRIVLLLPKESPEKGSPEVSQVPRHRPSLDKTKTSSSKCSFSEDISAKDITSVKHICEIPRSCQHPSFVDTNDDSDTMRNCRTTHVRTELPSTSSHALSSSEKKRDLHSARECVAKSRSDDDKAENSSVKERVEHAQLTGSNSRNPSPLCRFSFSLGQMKRSLSFKEDSAVPQLSSTHVSFKSGPASCDASNCVENSSNEKAKGHNRARSSPLRRLLDPLLKHKEANPAPHRSEYRLPPKVSFNSFSSGPVYSFPNEKIQESRVQALLQVKVNNGIPLFKFVVNNSSNILAATMKSLGSSDKDNSGWSYTFYLVNEIKKKSGGWISQGSKVKNCGYAYNIVGQMKVSTSDFSDQYITKESVLFGVERKQVDQGSPKFVPNRELVAAVVKIPSKDCVRAGHQSEDESEDKWCFPETRCSDRVSVILPGGVHGVPNKREPSPLISRWRSGGSCDCGGWDIGCKLQVLSDQITSARVSKGFKDGRILDNFELFAQVPEQNGPIFSLVPSKDGIYSVEYDSSISCLQAFFICVAMLSSRKTPHLSPAGNISEPKPFDQADTSPDRGLHVKFPAKYTTNPPLSPVGRV